MNMKRFFGLAMAGALTLSLLAGCGGNTAAGSASSSASKSSGASNTSSASADMGSASASGSTSAAEDDQSLINVTLAGKLILGLDDSFPPMGFRDDNGEIVGFDIDVATAVSEKLGVKLDVQPIDWEAKEEELNSGLIDCIWNGLSSTPERAETLQLSIPYMENHMALVTLPDSGIKSIDDMKGKKLALQSGSSAEDALNSEEGKSLKSIIDGEPNGFDTNLNALLDMETGASDAVLMDDVVANYLITENKKDYVVLGDFLYAEDYVIGFRKSDAMLTEAVNQALRDLKADGTLAKISEKWFGEDKTTVK